MVMSFMLRQFLKPTIVVHRAAVCCGRSLRSISLYSSRSSNGSSSSDSSTSRSRSRSRQQQSHHSTQASSSSPTTPVKEDSADINHSIEQNKVEVDGKINGKDDVQAIATSVASLSSSPPILNKDDDKIDCSTGPILVYKAMFAAKLKLLRRISLTSSISSVIGLVSAFVL